MNNLFCMSTMTLLCQNVFSVVYIASLHYYVLNPQRNMDYNPENGCDSLEWQITLVVPGRRITLHLQSLVIHSPDPTVALLQLKSISPRLLGLVLRPPISQCRLNKNEVMSCLSAMKTIVLH